VRTISGQFFLRSKSQKRCTLAIKKLGRYYLMPYLSKKILKLLLWMIVALKILKGFANIIQETAERVGDFILLLIGNSGSCGGK